MEKCLLNYPMKYKTATSYIPSMDRNRRWAVRQYAQPIPFAASMTVKASTTIDGRIMSLQAARQNFVMHKCVGKTITYLHAASSAYPADGSQSLLDGIKGTKALGQYWRGFNRNDLVATIDLGSETNIQTVTLGCLQAYGSWVFLPQWVRFEIGSDRENYKELQTIKNPFSINGNNIQHDFKANFSAVTARYIRITAKNNNCPADHPGAGNLGWIFADE